MLETFESILKMLILKKVSKGQQKQEKLPSIQSYTVSILLLSLLDSLSILLIACWVIFHAFVVVCYQFQV